MTEVFGKQKEKTMKRYLCFLLIVLMSLSFVLVSCSPETKAEEKKEETFTNDNATEVGKDVGTVGAVVATAVKTLDFENQPCTVSVDIASTTDRNLELVSNTVAPSTSTNLAFREVESSSTSGYHEIKLTFDVGKVVKEGLSKIEYKLSDTESFDKIFTKATEEEIANFKASQLYIDFENLLTLYSSPSNEFHFSGEVLTQLLSEIKDCAPDVTVEILIGENGAKGKLTVTAHFAATDDSITVTVREAVMKNSLGIELFSTSSAEFSVTFDDDFDIVFDADDSFDFKSVSGGVTVTVKKCTVLALAKTKFEVGGSVKYNFTSKKLDSSLTVKGGKLDAGFTVKAELTDKDKYVASLVNGLEVTKLSYDGTDFDTESVNTVLKTRREIIVKVLESYLDGSAISSLSTLLK